MKWYLPSSFSCLWLLLSSRCGFHGAFSPVVHDVSFRLLIIMQMIFKRKAIIMDVEVAFLNGDLEEEIYMECPGGMEHGEGECLLLLKALYGLVQVARQFFLKFSSIMMKLGFRKSPVDPCMMIKGEKDDLMVVIVHVDDCYVIGNEKSLQELVVRIKEHGLSVKVEHETKEYLGCEILFDKEQTKAWLGQPFIVKKMFNRFKDLINTRHIYRTPGTPGFTVVRPVTPEEQISPEDQKVYRSAVGSLLYLIKYSRPDIANTVRELSKCMDKATPAAFKEMKRVMRFVAGTKEYGLKLEPHSPNATTFSWNMVVYTDSDWAGDKDTRRSVSGYVLFLLTVPLMWKSKSQQGVSLSRPKQSTMQWLKR
jgi:Reverse transcriptase (RNA-dependent DNA polymerase)